MAKVNDQKERNGSALGFEAQLWAAADKMRGHMDASEYKHVCLGLIFLKYISHACEEKREQLPFGFSERDRIVHVPLTKKERGLNLNTPKPLIDDLTKRGKLAGDHLLDHFA